VRALLGWQQPPLDPILFLLIPFTHKFFEPLEYFIVPFLRILSVEYPMVFIWEIEESTRNTSSER
jgi:hypothetical protein